MTDSRNDDRDPRLPEQADTEAEAAPKGDSGALPAEEMIPEEEEAEELSEVEILQREMALLEQQLQQMRDRYIRAVADLDNARKRARQAISEARQQAIEAVLLDLLPLLDNFERALETVRPGGEGGPEGMRAVYDGVALIYRQFRDMLERRGVRPIESMGEPFDPSRHEAVAQVPAGEDHPEGTVALEMQKGYMHGDRVLRPSRVGVAVKDRE